MRIFDSLFVCRFQNVVMVLSVLSVLASVLFRRIELGNLVDIYGKLLL